MLVWETTRCLQFVHVVLCTLVAMGVVPRALAEVSVERGDYLVNGPAACGNCHTPQGPDGPALDRAFGGFLVEKNPAFEAWASNITPASRIEGWSDDELARAIREGLRPDGSLIGPPMPFQLYLGLSDDDLYSIVAYLRSIPRIDNEVPASTYNIPLPPAYGPPVETVAAVEPGVTVEYGAYLAGPIAHCTDCHTPMGEKGRLFETHLGAGGFEFHGPWGTSVAPNLTSHNDGLAGYSDDELKAMIVKGVRPDGTPMLPPMGYGYYARMSERDLDAIILYLRQLPALPDPS